MNLYHIIFTKKTMLVTNIGAKVLYLHMEYIRLYVFVKLNHNLCEEIVNRKIKISWSELKLFKIYGLIWKYHKFLENYIIYQNF